LNIPLATDIEDFSILFGCQDIDTLAEAGPNTPKPTFPTTIHRRIRGEGGLEKIKDVCNNHWIAGAIQDDSAFGVFDRWHFFDESPIASTVDVLFSIHLFVPYNIKINEEKKKLDVPGNWICFWILGSFQK
jgi:hypothetical protein